MNRNIKSFISAGLFVIAFIFVFPLFQTPEEYYRTITFLLPIAIVVFIAPTGAFFLNRWDIHFNFEDENRIRPIIANLGIAPFNFNKVQFASDKKFKIFGKTDYYPIEGIFDNDVEYHGAETGSRVLHEHTGCSIRQGLPISVWVRSDKLKEYLQHFKNKKRIYMCLYYGGTKQRVYSQPIPVKIINKIVG